MWSYASGWADGFELVVVIVVEEEERGNRCKDRKPAEDRQHADFLPRTRGDRSDRRRHGLGNRRRRRRGN